MKKWLCFIILAGMFIATPKAAQAAEMSETEVTETEATQTDAEPAAYITTANLNLRESPTTESDKYITVPRGTIIQVTDFLDFEWYYVTYKNYTGYMKAEYLAPFTPGADESAPSAEPAKIAETSVGTVEMLDWADAKKIFTLHTPAQVIDVRTKITYWVASFSNGKHADVEPVTADDTAAMKRTYGGKWSWDTRPVLVIINGRTLAASINGMPHGGGTNDDNNMNGQVCIHFKGSKTHNGNKSHEKDHQNAVSEAFNTAKNW